MSIIYDPRVDEYIANAPEFAKPILEYLRQTVHEVCPQTEETIKWKFPTFMYNSKILCSVVSFKNYCSMGFWLHGEMKTIQSLETDAEKSNMFSLGKITKLDDLPGKIRLREIIQEAMDLTDAGFKMKKTAPNKTEVEVPDYFKAALDQNKLANEVFIKASPSFRKEYIHWIAEAKTESTRTKRMEQALEWISVGKGRNWKYEKKK
jgi:uncharacterized protein YdeI (YjbR/CyaY-like superfamily)